jgi:hypothetical protein
VACIVPKGQHWLRPAYDALHSFANAGDAAAAPKAAWADKVLVQAGSDMYAGLAAFAKHLLTMPGAPLYLDNTDVANGLWLGHIAESDDVLDAEGIHGATALDVEVLTGDAAGRMGGGWWRTERMAFEFPI